MFRILHASLKMSSSAVRVAFEGLKFIYGKSSKKINRKMVDQGRDQEVACLASRDILN